MIGKQKSIINYTGKSLDCRKGGRKLLILFFIYYIPILWVVCDLIKDCKTYTSCWCLQEYEMLCNHIMCSKFSYLKVFFINTHAPYWSWNHDAILHLALIRGGAVWTRAHWLRIEGIFVLVVTHAWERQKDSYKTSSLIPLALISPNSKFTLRVSLEPRTLPFTLLL